MTISPEREPVRHTVLRAGSSQYQILNRIKSSQNALNGIWIQTIPILIRIKKSLHYTLSSLEQLFLIFDHALHPRWTFLINMYNP